MPGQPARLGPFEGGLNNSAGQGDYIDDTELYELINLEVDTDGSLVNRPPIAPATLNFQDGGTTVHIGELNNIVNIGTFSTSGGSHYVVVSYDYNSSSFVGLIDAETIPSGEIVVSKEVHSVCAIQYNDKLYVIPHPLYSGSGGYFSVNLIWNDVPDLPVGGTAAIYNERMWIGPGPETTNTTNMYRIKFSNIGDAETWGALDYFDIGRGDGQVITSLITVFNDLFVFKTHSTYRLSYGSDVFKAQISNLSTSIGTPNWHTVSLYNNRSMYLYHNRKVYELFNYNFTEIGQKISKTQDDESSGLSMYNVGISVFSDRLFYTYFGHTYVMSLTSNKWCEWVDNHTEDVYPGKASWWGVTSVQTSSGEVAFCVGTNSIAPSQQDNDSGARPGYYTFTSSRVFTDRVDVHNSLSELEVSLVTKTYDFESSWAYKVIFWLGATVATESDLNIKLTVPNAGSNYTWNDWSTRTWGDLLNDPAIQWSNNSKLIFEDSVVPGLGGYARKMYKFKKKLRFRQAFIQVTSKAVPNTSGADSMFRLYDLTAFVNVKETVVKRLS